MNLLLSPAADWDRRLSGLLIGGAALVLGLLMALLPLPLAAALLLGGLLVIGTLVEPLIGLGLALLLGPAKPFTDYFYPQIPLDLGQLTLIMVLGVWALHMLARRRVELPRSPLNMPLLALIGVFALTLLDTVSLGSGIEELIKWGQIAVVMWLVIDRTRYVSWQWVLAMVILAGLAQAFIGIWQFGLRGDGPEHFLILGDRFYRAYGSFEQPNPYGGFLGLILSLAVGLSLGALRPPFVRFVDAFRGKRSIKAAGVIELLLTRDSARLLAYTVLAGLLLAGLLMSWSRGAWLGFAAAAAAMLFVWPRRVELGVVLIVVGIMGAALAFQFDLLPAAISSRLTSFTDFISVYDVRGVDINNDNYSLIERIAHWQAAISMADANPWLGVGLGNYEVVYGDFALINWPYPLGHAHNIYLNMLAETGILGLFTYLVFWAYVLGLTWQVTRSRDLLIRSVGIGLVGAWVHLAAHQVVDKLYVANLHLHMGAMLGILSVLWVQVRAAPTVSREQHD